MKCWDYLRISFTKIYFYEINYERAASTLLLSERAQKRGVKFSGRQKLKGISISTIKWGQR